MYNVIICCDSASSLYDRLCAVRHYFEAPVFGGEERPLNLLETGRVSQISAQAPILILPKALHEPVIGSGAVFAVIANSDFFQAEELRPPVSRSPDSHLWNASAGRPDLFEL